MLYALAVIQTSYVVWVATPSVIIPLSPISHHAPTNSLSPPPLPLSPICHHAPMNSFPTSPPPGRLTHTDAAQAVLGHSGGQCLLPVNFLRPLHCLVSSCVTAYSLCVCVSFACVCVCVYVLRLLALSAWLERGARLTMHPSPPVDESRVSPGPKRSQANEWSQEKPGK